MATVAPCIYYLCPDYKPPSWGIGLLYSHVEMLNNNGYEAVILHHNSPFRLDWLASPAPVRYLDSSDFRAHADDILVVPEVLAADPIATTMGCRKIMFAQGIFLIHPNLRGHKSLSDLGYEQAIATMPHVKEVIERHYDLTAHTVPPFVADYFFVDQSEPPARQNRILTVPKDGYAKAGYFDYQIITDLLRHELTRRPGWQMVELAGLPHREVARMMQSSRYLVNVNCLESFNATVPEAMAAGCVPVCYEAYGGRDFLQPEQNALVFSNNDVYRLADCLFKLIDGGSENGQRIERIRHQGQATARQFSRGNTERNLLDFYRCLCGP